MLSNGHAHLCAFAVLCGCAWSALAERSSAVGAGWQALRRAGRQTHVTRLHRHEHSGIDAMKEAEAKWHAGVPGDQVGQKRLLKLSEQQINWLEEHQQRSLVELSSSMVQERQGQMLRSIYSHKQGSFATHAERFNVSAELPTTMLSSLDSQYVGPVGIGTVSRPSGCRAEHLQYVAHARTGDNQALLEQCHAEEQAEVFVVFDTGSTNLWVASDLCNQGGCARADRARYNHVLSQTYSEPSSLVDLHVQFGTGSLSGPMGVDDLHVGPFTVYNQSFGLIQQAEGSVFENTPLEGILGLAFPAMAARGSSPFFDTIIEQKALKSNKFAFYFSLSNPSANAIFWGDVDTNFHEGAIQYHKVTDPYYWSVDLLSFQVGGEEMLGDGKHSEAAKGGSSLLEAGPFSTPKAVVDTGTTFFTAGGSLYRKIGKALPSGQCNEMTDESHPPILFRLAGEDGKPVDYELTNEQYMVESNGHCSLAFMHIDIPRKHGPGMILGEVFLRHYLAVFDRGDGDSKSSRVGFAKSAHGDHVDKRLKDLTHNQATFAEARHRVTS